MRLICAIFLIFIAFCQSDNGKVEANFEDAKRILPGRTYYWKNWRFCQDDMDDMHIWSEAVALKFWLHCFLGCIKFIIDHKLWKMCSNGGLNNRIDSDYEDELETFKRMNNLIIQARPILSYAGSTKLTFENWFMVSRKEGEISIEYEYAPLVITLREDFPGFKVESNGTTQTFTATTLLGAEFATSWIPVQKINQSSLRAEVLKSETEQHSNVTSCFALNRENSDNGWTEIQCHSDALFHNISYTWKINRFDLHLHRLADERKGITSPLFSSTTYNKIEWRLRLELGNKTSEKLSLHLCRWPNSTETPALAQLSFDFLDSKGNTMYTLTPNRFKTYSAGDCWGWYNYIPINEVVSSDNTLNIVCKIAVCEFTTNSFHLNHTDISMNPRNCRSKNIIHSSIKNSDDSDVVLVLLKTGKEYPANKSVLAAGSPTFATMFNISRTEKSEKIDRVNITDVDSEQVMDELLKYIYTSNCENIETLAYDLLIAAHKYELDHLKQLCVEKITDNLTIGNAAHTLNLADQHGFDKLKSKTIRFIAANYAQVSNTSDWKHIVKTKNGELLHEVCQLLSNQLSNKEVTEV